MLSVYVLKLMPAELAAGRLVGEIEHVASQSTALIHNVEELIGFLAQCTDDVTGDR